MISIHFMTGLKAINSLNVNKINYMLFTNIETHPALGNLKIQIGNEELEQKKSVKFLGITIDDHLTWQDHIISVKNKISQTLYNFKMIKTLMPKHVLKTLYMTHSTMP